MLGAIESLSQTRAGLFLRQHDALIVNCLSSEISENF
jgi:hypothetical protein